MSRVRYVIEQLDFKGRARRPRLFFCLSKHGNLNSSYQEVGPGKVKRTSGPNTTQRARAFTASTKRDAVMIAVLVDALFRHQDFVWRAVPLPRRARGRRA